MKERLTNYTRGTATIVTIDMEEVLISNNNSFETPLSKEEEVQGYHIFRLDTPVLNATGDKLIIGTWMGKTDPTQESVTPMIMIDLVQRL